MNKLFSLLVIVGAASLHLVKAFSLNNNPQDRRTILKQLIVSVTAVSLPSSPSNASLLDNTSPDLPAFSGSVAEAKERFKLAVDNVRLYLGTQGVKSHMYGIMKVLKTLKDEADDIVEYTEAMDSFEAYKNQAEGAAYQSMFVEHSSAKGTPESFLKTAKGDVVNLRKYMGDLAMQLHLDV